MQPSEHDWRTHRERPMIQGVSKSIPNLMVNLQEGYVSRRLCAILAHSLFPFGRVSTFFERRIHDEKQQETAAEICTSVAPGGGKPLRTQEKKERTLSAPP